MTEKRLQQLLHEYYELDNLAKKAAKRAKYLNERIKRVLMHRTDIAPHTGETITYGRDAKYCATVQIKTPRRRVDPAVLEQLIVDKNLWGECTRRKVDEDLVEQAYIEGKITDSDLRSINAGPEIQLALKVVKNDVQSNNEGVGGRQGARTLHDRTHSEDFTQIGGDTTSVGEGESNPSTDV